MATSALAICCLLLLGACCGSLAERRLLQNSTNESTGDLFVVTAASASLVLFGEEGSLQLDGVSPVTIWFADKPTRTGGQLDSSQFLGNNFFQNGKWISNPNVALYSSNSNGMDDDTVVALAILSNPQMLNATSVLFPLVSTLASTSNRPSSVAAYYSSYATGSATGPRFLSAASSNVTELRKVAMFVDPYYCGCGCGGWCGCGWHDTGCLRG